MWKSNTADIVSQQTKVYSWGAVSIHLLASWADWSKKERAAI